MIYLRKPRHPRTYSQWLPKYKPQDDLGKYHVPLKQATQGAIEFDSGGVKALVAGPSRKFVTVTTCLQSSWALSSQLLQADCYTLQAGTRLWKGIHFRLVSQWTDVLQNRQSGGHCLHSICSNGWSSPLTNAASTRVFQAST